MDEQERIVDTLNRIDRATGLQRQAIERTRALLQSAAERGFASLGDSRQTLGQFVLSIRNGYGRRPRGTEDGPIVLRLADVASGHVDLSTPRRIAMPSDEFGRYQLSPGDLLFIRVNGSRDLVGRCVHYDLDQSDVAFNDHLIRVRLDAEQLLPKYVAAWTSTVEARGQVLRRAITSAGQYTINQVALSSLELPVPDTRVQERIVTMLNRVEKTLGLQGRALATLNSLMQSALHRAFRGEL